MSARSSAFRKPRVTLQTNAQAPRATRQVVVAEDVGLRLAGLLVLELLLRRHVEREQVHVPVREVAAQVVGGLREQLRRLGRVGHEVRGDALR